MSDNLQTCPGAAASTVTVHNGGYSHSCWQPWCFHWDNRTFADSHLKVVHLFQSHSDVTSQTAPVSQCHCAVSRNVSPFLFTRGDTAAVCLYRPTSLPKVNKLGRYKWSCTVDFSFNTRTSQSHKLNPSTDKSRNISSYFRYSNVQLMQSYSTVRQ